MAERWNAFINTATLVILKDKLRELNLPTSGNKAVVKLRLQEAVQGYSEVQLANLVPNDFGEGHSGGDDDDDSEDADIDADDEESINSEIQRLRNIIEKKKEIARLKAELRELHVDDIRNKEVIPRSTVHNFRDIEDSIPSFSGDDNYPVQRWIEQFEEFAEVLNYDEKTKFVYGKRFLTGTSKLFIRTIVIKSWPELKKALLRKFLKNVTKADIHNELRNRKKRREENLQQYVLIMQEIASTVSIDEQDLIQYIINGIPDNDQNKIILHNANNINDLKVALRKYERIKSNHRENFHKTADLQKNTFVKSIKCFKCHEIGHSSKSCKKQKYEKKNEIKCYKCLKPGHLSSNCPDKLSVMTMQSAIRKNVDNLQLPDHHSSEM